ncbi:manganese efflux pump [Paenibacillus sp. JTLBN-2024]|uniref:Membrane protein YtaF n=1 Tax=Paenibacillus cookii TaxID=157839 RepID=A0ABQ4M157_9BACL|nr:manganese efflux pump [Paenibacillus cookii]KHF36504.1 manganese efflux pump MntP [Paenibacillus sp. P1XP2]GIO69262.1 putative membrane protein YtaF [Paenibacillus cookii]HWO55723.1 manganese efflux pump [Paenibacillus cookii]
MLSHVFSLLLLAFALSLDSFGVGITYGLRQMKISSLSVVIISICSGVIIYISMQVGVLLARVVSPDAASVVGAVILIIMGSWSLIQLVIQKEKERDDKPDDKHTANIKASDQSHASGAALPTASREMPEQTVFSLEIRKLGLVIRILRTPSSADIDKSGSISGFEAMWLGIALSLDAFGAGLGAALLGFSPVWTALVIALFSGTFLVVGMKTGFKFAARSWMRHFTALPALLLIAMGIIKLL